MFIVSYHVKHNSMNICHVQMLVQEAEKAFSDYQYNSSIQVCFEFH